MATDAPLLTRQRVFAAKVESTTGTAETLTASHAAYNVFDPVFTPNIDMNERNGQSNLSPRTSITGSRGGTLAFDTELVGKGSSGAPTYADTLLVACGWNNSTGTTYVLDSDNVTTLTMGMFEDGRRRFLLGCMGTFTMNFTTGNPVRISWEFSGKLGANDDTTILAPTYPTTLPPRFAAATLTVGGTAYKVSEATISMNNEVTMRANQADAGGFHAAYITARSITVTMDPESQLYATQDWHTDWISHTEAALNLVVGSATNNTMTITAPKMQLTNAPVADRDGIMTEALEFQCNRSAAAGDDELQIVFS